MNHPKPNQAPRGADLVETFHCRGCGRDVHIRVRWPASGELVLAYWVWALNSKCQTCLEAERKN